MSHSPVPLVKAPHFEGKPKWTKEEAERFFKANQFNPNSIGDYESGKLIPDCTTIQKAAEAGCLDFLKWCAKNGFVHEFTSTAASYALKGKQKETFEWLISSGVITSYEESAIWIDHWRPDAAKLEIDMSLFQIIDKILEQSQVQSSK